MDDEYMLEMPESYLPEGYVIVPKKPTERMMEAGIMLHSQFNSSVAHVYNAMIEEAQEEE